MSQKKNFQAEKIFKIDIFVLKHVLDHSKSIPTKKIFRKIFDFLVIFCHFWAQKIDFLNFWGENFEIFFTDFKRILLQSFFAITCIPTPIEHCRLTRFIEFLTKNSQKQKFFENIGSKKIFFEKNFCTLFQYFLLRFF